MPRETSRDKKYELTDVIDFAHALHVAEVTARVATAEEDKLIREWTVVKTVGREMLRRRWLEPIQKEYDFTEEELVKKWEEFIDQGLLASIAILADLKIDAPENINANYWDSRAGNGIAGMGTSPEGVHTLYLYLNSLITFFIRFVRSNRESDKVFVLKEFEAVLAHEFYHIFQRKRFPLVMQREKEKNYWDRRFEYGARLYSLQWLRKQKPKSNAERIGMWKARADVLITQVSNQTHVRDEINEIFGVRKPRLLHHLKMVFKEDKQ